MSTRGPLLREHGTHSSILVVAWTPGGWQIHWNVVTAPVKLKTKWLCRVGFVYVSGLRFKSARRTETNVCRPNFVNGDFEQELQPMSI